MKTPILVVDDQKGVRHLITEAFRGTDIDVAVAGTGQEALEIMKHIEFSLILLDMKMPGMTGMELLKKIRERGCQSQVILMTAYDELDLAFQVEELGVYKSIAKPFDIVELQALVKETLASSSSIC